MNHTPGVGLIFVSLTILVCQTARAQPPFNGTIFVDPDIVTPSDPTSFTGMTDAGRGIRSMYDFRVTNRISVNAYLFNASFSDGLNVEIQVNPEFGSAAAASFQADTYARIIGRLPTLLRSDLETVWIHQGDAPLGFGGGNNNILIHTGQGDSYEADGILEEAIFHEGAHTSLDADHASSPGWRAAQLADGEFISNHAQKYPTQEDIAESFLLWFAVRYRFDRISASLLNTVISTIPNRLAYFDNQNFNLSNGPQLPNKATAPSPTAGAGNQSINVDLSWSNGGGANTYNVYFGTDATPDSGESRGNQEEREFDPGVLAYNTTYYWRIDARNTAGVTTGDVWSFTTGTNPLQLPNKATAPSPPAGAGNQSINVDLSWSNGGGANTYNVYFGTDATPDSGESRGNQEEREFDPGGLAYNTTYYWRIDARNTAGVTTGDVWSFTTSTNPLQLPNKATAPSPPAGAGNQPINVDLSWSNGGGAASYDVYFGTDPNPAAGEFRGNRTGTLFDPGTLAYNTTYYWRIDAVNAAGTTLGDIWLFTTGPAPPQLPSKTTAPNPVNGAVNQSINVDLSWSNGGGANTYNVYFGTDATPDSGESRGNQEEREFDPGMLAYNTTYYWRIDARNTAGVTTGDVWSFTTTGTSCSYFLSPTNVNRSSDMAFGSFVVIADSGCSWGVSNVFTWIHTSGSGSGNGTVDYTIDANPGTTSRIGTITVQGQPFTINQGGVSINSNLPPVITMGPTDLAVGVGQSAMFRVSANGNPTPNFQWQRSTDGGANWSNLHNDAIHSGSTTATLTINNTTTGMSGYRFRARVSNTAGNSTSISGTLTVNPPSQVSLTVTSDGSGTVSRGFAGSTLRTIGKQYTIKATPGAGYVFAGWSGSLTSNSTTLTFMMQADMVLQANFVPNPFIPLKGTYTGLFYDSTATDWDSSGFLTLTLTERGSYSGRLFLAGSNYPVSGVFDLALASKYIVPRRNTNELLVFLQLAHGSDWISGSVSNSNFQSDLLGYRPGFSTANPATNIARKFTALFSGGGDDARTRPIGNSYATLSVANNGSVTFKARLSDGKSAVQIVPLAADGHFPIYRPIYSGSGSIFGWFDIMTNNLVGWMIWTKTGATSGNLYRSGFTNRLQALGSRYDPPLPGAPVIDWPDVAVHLEGGNLTVPLGIDVMLPSSRKFVVTPSNTNKLAVSVNPSNGTFSGTFLNPGTRKTSQIRGVLLQRQRIGGGYFLGTNQTGRVSIEP